MTNFKKKMFIYYYYCRCTPKNTNTTQIPINSSCVCLFVLRNLLLKY